MSQTKPGFEDRAPFLVMGVLCWLCGAVVVGVAARLIFGWVEAAVAVVVTSAPVLAVFWALSSSMPPRSGRSRN